MAGLSFDAPWLGLAVAGVAVLYLAVWAAAERRRRQAALRFADPELLRRVVGNGPGWRRHVAPAAVGLTLVLAAGAAADPQVFEETDRVVTQVVLAIDVSPSMVATDVAPTRLAAAQRAALAFVRAAPEGIEVGLATFAGSATAVVRPTANRTSLVNAIGRLEVPDGGTAVGDGITTSVGMLSLPPEPEPGQATGTVVLLSDGETNMGRPPLDAAEDAAAAGVVVHAVGLGTPEGELDGVPLLYDEEELAAIAETTGGDLFTAATSDQVTAVFGRLGSSIEPIFTTRSVAHLVAVAAAVVLGLGAVVGLRRTQRVL